MRKFFKLRLFPALKGRKSGLYKKLQMIAVASKKQIRLFPHEAQ